MNKYIVDKYFETGNDVLSEIKWLFEVYQNLLYDRYNRVYYRVILRLKNLHNLTISGFRKQSKNNLCPTNLDIERQIPVQALLMLCLPVLYCRSSAVLSGLHIEYALYEIDWVFCEIKDVQLFGIIR